MLLNQIAAFALVALVIVLVILAAITALRRTSVDAAQRRRLRLEAEIRPQLLHLLANEDPGLTFLAPAGRPAGRVLDSIATGLLPKLRGSDRDGVVELLEQRGAVERARKATRSLRGVVRARAGEQLGDIGLPWTQPAVAALLNDRHPEVRATAARALGKLGDAEAVPSLLRALDRGLVTPNIVSMAVMRLGLGAIEPLQRGLEDSDTTARVVCSEILGLQGAVSAVPSLAKMAIHDLQLRVRIAAIRALGRIGSPTSLTPLLTCLNADEPAVRAEAARSLGRLGTAAAISPLTDALSDEHEVAYAAAVALAAHGEHGRDQLERIGALPTQAGRYATAALSTVTLERARYAPAQVGATQ
jgi:HEAT repeat protein